MTKRGRKESAADAKKTAQEYMRLKVLSGDVLAIINPDQILSE